MIGWERRLSAVRYRAAVVWRVFVEMLLCLVGLFHVAPLFRVARRPRIGFQTYGRHLAISLAPVIDQMRYQVPDVEVDFIVLGHPQFSIRSWHALRRFARDRLRLPSAQVRFFWQSLWRRYDLLVCADVYARFPLRPARTVLLKHGAGVSARALRPHWLRKTVDDFDLVLVNGEADRASICRHAPAHGVAGKVVAAGLPHMDRLENCAETRERYCARIGIPPERKVALVGPSWRGLQAIQARQPGYFDQVIAALQDLDWEVLIKMHACSFNPAMVGGDDWAARVAGYLRPRVHVDTDVDDVPALVHADLLITDISSRAFDFMLLDKPVIAVVPEGLFCDEFDAERIDLLKQGAHVIESPADLGRAVAEAQMREGITRPARRELAHALFANRGRATSAVVDHLLRQLPGRPEGLVPVR
jgi:hypothetical protein